MTFSAGRDALNTLADVLDLSERNTRVIIDIEVDSVPRIIKVDLLTDEQLKALAETLKTIGDVMELPNGV